MPLDLKNKETLSEGPMGPSDEMTEIVLVIDRSGSMVSIRPDMEGGVNQFLNDQKQVPGDARVTVVMFDTVYEIPFAGVPIRTVGQVHIQPRGNTALLDAMGRAISDTAERVKAQPADKVIVIIVTDGQENSSREFSKDQVQKLIAERPDWQFLFLGEDMSTIAESHKLGVAPVNTINFVKSAKSTHTMYSNLSKNVASYRSGGAASAAFTAQDYADQVVANDETDNPDSTTGTTTTKP